MLWVRPHHHWAVTPPVACYWPCWPQALDPSSRTSVPASPGSCVRLLPPGSEWSLVSTYLCVPGSHLKSGMGVSHGWSPPSRAPSQQGGPGKHFWRRWKTQKVRIPQTEEEGLMAVGGQIEWSRSTIPEFLLFNNIFYIASHWSFNFCV